ncbi:MAG TPA: hypothetical protein DCP91_05440, partial [Eggerthellaceae bacterium]|nr:hypothetical protein [Eggerthellaceae bacterium]
MDIVRDEQRIGDVLAVVAFAVYVVGEFLFRCAMLRTSFPVIAEVKLLEVFEALSMALAIAAVATRRRALSSGQ